MRAQLRRLLAALGLVTLPPLNGVHLRIENRIGSVQHYYHFMLGFLVPLIHGWPRIKASAEGRAIYVRSCAVMDPLLHEIDLDGLVVLSAGTHNWLHDDPARAHRYGHQMDFVEIEGFDTPSAYDPDVFLRVRKWLTSHLCSSIASHENEVSGLWRGDGPRVLIIDRLPPHPFYGSDESEIKEAGAQRRSIQNKDAVFACARAHFPSVASIALETRSLSFQIALFQQVDIIIAQHGAALANLLWAQPGTFVVEVLSEALATSPTHPLFFSKLSSGMGLEHHVISQPDDHGPADIAALDALLVQSAATLGSRRPGMPESARA